MRSVVSILTVLGLCQVSAPLDIQAWAQERQSPFEGMWSDPPVSLFDTFCAGACTDAGLDHLEALLDDPANDDRPYGELASEAADVQINEYFKPLLIGEALATFPLDHGQDPGFLYCEPWGVGRQLTARHQLEIRDEGDRLELSYGEWAAHRIVFMDGRVAPEDLTPSRMGFSVGRYDSGALIIETTGIMANLMNRPTQWKHSDELRIVERYTVSEDGERLFLTASYDDPLNLREPLVVKKVWGWAPHEEITPELQCEPAVEYLESGDGQ